MGAQEVGGGRYGRTGVDRGGRGKLRQSAGNIKVGRVAQRDGVNLARGHQAAQHLAHLAAGGERGQEQLDLFHAGGDHRLQVDGGKHRDGRHLGGGGAFGNGFLETQAQQLPLGRLAGSGDDRNDAKLLPELGDGAQDGAFGHFPAQSAGEFAKGRVARLQQLVSLDGKLRYLAGTG